MPEIELLRTLLTAIGLYLFVGLDARSTPWDIIWSISPCTGQTISFYGLSWKDLGCPEPGSPRGFSPSIRSRWSLSLG